MSRFEKFEVIAVVLLLVAIAYSIIETAHAHSVRVEPVKTCVTQWLTKVECPE